MPWVRLILIIAAVAVSGFAKEIRLRNGRLATPEKDARAQAAATTPASGLFLVQFERPLNDAQRAQLQELNVSLLSPIPEDAYVARLRGTSLAGLRGLTFVRWVGAFEPRHKVDASVADLKERRPVAILAAPDAPADEMARIRKLAGGLEEGAATPAGKILRANVNARQVEALSRSPAILWIEPGPRPKLFDEMASEIVGGEFAGRGSLVNEIGYDGAGVSVAVADSGLQFGTVAGMHPDLAGRVDAFFYYGRLQDASDEHGHGTHVTGIVAGDGAAGETDETGFLYGLGVAPESHIVAQRLFDGLGGYEPPASFAQLTTDAVRAGAVIGSNSWGDDTQGRYDLSAMEFDALVRDADPQTPGDQPYILEFSAGNAGPGERTIGSPAVGKNVIATGACENNRFEFIIYAEGQDNMADFSSRGPAEDGRIKPDIVAPGTWIASLQSAAASDENAWLPISPFYQYQGGTSQAGPHASGAAAVFVQYYRELNEGRTPSPALVKAALINSAADMDAGWGTAAVPNHDEGWGRIDLTELIGADRNYDFVDQSALLTQDGLFEKRIYIADETMPLKITLAYTDFPGTPLTIPALVNDLNLEVVSPEGIVFAGNQFINGESVPAAAARDNVNNVEGVHLSFPSPGEYLIRVRAARIAQDVRADTAATDQDFALVVSGGIPDPSLPLIIFNRRAYAAPATIRLRLIDFDRGGQPEAVLNLSSTTEPTPMTLRLQPFGTIGVFTGAVTTAQGPATDDGVLQIRHGDTITATYRDEPSGQTFTATARADLVPPAIASVTSTNRFGRQIVSFDTDERASAVIRYGTSLQNLDNAVTNLAYRISHQLALGNLAPGQTYYFVVTAHDEAGNAAVNDNNGIGFSFVAQPPSTVLLVDNYIPTPDDPAVIPVTAYTDALDQTGVSYEVWHIPSEGEPQLADLRPFRVVIWRINDSFYQSTSLSLSQQSLLTNYLAGDGSLLVASMELLTRLGDTPFRTNVFQVAEFTSNPDPFSECPTCDEDHGVPVLEGSQSDSIGSGVMVTLNYDQYPYFDFGGIFPNIGPDLSDTFTPTTNAVPIFLDADSGRVTGIRAPRSLESSGRVVFLAFPLDSIPMEGPAPNSRPDILRSILSFLAPGINGLGSINLDRPAYSTPDQVVIQIADSDLAGRGRAMVRASTRTDSAGLEVELLETPRPGVFAGTVRLVASDIPAPGKLRAAHGDVITIEYFDASSSFTVRANAYVDTIIPTISNLQIDPDFELAVVSWMTDEQTDALVQFGESTFLGRTAFRSSLSSTHELTLNGLAPDRRYYYQVVSRDEAGNVRIDDNGGNLYSFRTRAPTPLPWSDDLEGAADGWTVESTEDSEFGWELGTPANGLQSAGRSGVKAWGSNLRGSFGTYSETALISPAFELTGGTRATLRFWNSYDFTLEATYEAASLYVITNSQTAPVLLGVYEGLAASWEEEEFDLTPYMGRIVRFAWLHQLLDFEAPEQPHVGWLIDDVSVRIEGGGGEVGELRVTSNLSQATYTISGPSATQAAGLSYTNPSARAGSYTVTFADVPFYITPSPQTGFLAANGSLSLRGVYTFTDENQNRIADDWERLHFGALLGPDGAAADPDGDSYSNFSEWTAGTSPRQNESRLAILSMFITPEGVRFTWPSSSGRAYRVLRSTDAVTWAPAEVWVRATGAERSFTIPFEDATGVFFKVEVRP